MDDAKSWGTAMRPFWKTPDGSIITEANTTPNGRIVVRTDSGKTYIIPKRCTNRLRVGSGEMVPINPQRGAKTIRVSLPSGRTDE